MKMKILLPLVTCSILFTARADVVIRYRVESSKMDRRLQVQKDSIFIIERHDKPIPKDNFPLVWDLKREKAYLGIHDFKNSDCSDRPHAILGAPEIDGLQT